MLKKDTFTNRLATLRKLRGLSQYDLANMTGISQRMIAHYETKIKNPSHKNIILLANALKVSADELIGNKPVKEKAIVSNKKILKKLKLLEELSPYDQKSIFKIINALHAKHLTNKTIHNQ